MTPLRYFLAALLASASLSSCSFEHYDSRTPTVAQQDAYDVAWGLPARKPRGNPRMHYKYNARAEQAEQSAPMSLNPPSAAPAPSSAPAPVSPAPAGSATIPPNLR
ncbi:hypothetical protein [Prosthecobacter sp.]|uniref:hypothetical protein n=1 Tax=Prosthecobacter sp. TaxID=1965333 RepID=UPI003782F0F3